ncbi:patatin-like phospholipase family protein [bacterium]|nr:patatin-like phospholipase family protein [bacterium]MBU1958812.1 patatin-like phospholipase family protein [bacterium]
MKNLKLKPFTLVLSGGGALGIAHLGVLHDLEENGIVPQEIVGTSMGGIIGACMAIGLNESKIHQLLQEFSAVYKWISFSWSGNALIDNHKIEKIFENIFQKKKMSETMVPLKLIATDLETGEKRVFTQKDNVYIKDAVLATMAIPGIFDEHLIDGKHYVDGFLCENLGINEASYQDILAVDVLGKNSFEPDLPDNFFKTNNILEMFEKSIRLLIYNQTQTNIKYSSKNITLIEPDTKEYKTFHFHKVDEIRSLGLSSSKGVI